jgi:dipeptidyl aminopeptidase/acylaminoacyl peptidase
MKQSFHVIALAVAAALTTETNAQDHAFSVKDDIEMIRFSDPLALPGSSEMAQRSPDGKHFAIVTTRGLLSTDRVESTIAIFDAGEVRRLLESPKAAQPPAPRTIATLTSFPHHEEPYAYAPVIKDMRWSPDSTRIYFRGEDLQGAYRLYEAKIDHTEFQALTPPGYSVNEYDISADSIVYRASHTQDDHVVSGDVINADARVMTAHRLRDVIFSSELSGLEPKTFMMWVMRRVDGKYVTTQIPGYSVREQDFPFGYPFALSPKGDTLVEIDPVTRIPSSWEAYAPANGYEHLRYRSSDPRLTSENNLYRLKQYTLVDLTSGKQAPLVNAPNATTLAYVDPDRAAWASNGRRVLLTNTFLPLDHVTAEEHSQHLRPCAIVSVDVPALEAHCLIFNENRAKQDGVAHVQEVSFGETDSEALLAVDLVSGKREVRRYQYRDGDWRLVSARPIWASSWTSVSLKEELQSQSSDVQLVVKQTLNEPPALWATRTGTNQSRKLWDPNPQLAQVQFGDVSVYHWKDESGYVWTGGLVRPVDYVPGRRYPLVLQIYNFNDGQFMTDGMDPTAFAARHLASAGIVALQIQRRPHTYDSSEADDQLIGFESAVAQLSREGLVDPNKVGLVGFSASCWYVENALIKAPRLAAAATIADGVDHSYINYHLFGESSSAIQHIDETIIGAKPVAGGLETWLKLAPGFHLDQVETPLRIETITPMSLIGEWEIYSSLRMQNKPVDLIYFPFGTHIHQKPLERLESQQGDVDWFRFWLQGYEDPDVTKRPQYERWEKLRDERDTHTKLIP